MAEYVKLLSEFQEFIDHSRTSFSSEYEKKLINLILSDFDNVAKATTAVGQRAKLINSLIQSKGKSISSEIPEFGKSNQSASFGFSRIESLEVESFRGFSHKEIFTFPTRFTFIFGPNGSGKSSFCEALEFSMLNYINESIRKSIDIKLYTKNMFTGASKKPILKVKANDDSVIEVVPDLNRHQFCFVEKNRIDDFSRIAANSPAKATPFLATLFGLKEFSEFVKNFTDNIEKQVNVETKKKTELESKSAGRIQCVNYIEKAKIQKADIEVREKSFSDLLNLGVVFGKLKETISGIPGTVKGLIDLENDKIDKVIPSKLALATKDTFESEIDIAVADLAAVKQTFDALAMKSGETNFQQLFEAAVALKGEFSDQCPLCLKKFDHTHINPYERAQAGIDNLKELAELQGKRDTEWAKFTTSYRTVTTSIVKRQNVAQSAGFTEKFEDMKSVDEESTEKNFENLSVFSNSLASVKGSLEVHGRLDLAIIAFNIEIETQMLARTQAMGSKELLQKHVSDIEKFELEEKGNRDLIDGYEKEIREFDEANKTLIDEVEKERVEIEENVRFVAGYRTFLEKIKKYNEELPAKLVSELNELTLDIYNRINKHDLAFEKLSKLNLPSVGEDRLTVAFQNDSHGNLDVLQVLSEGHLRCLGLSILLAKVVKDQIPVIIFDDIVNALDDDHRGGVRELLFEFEPFKEKQIILTTHNENFVRELEQHIELPAYEKIVTKYQLRQDSSQRRIRITEKAFKNYLVEAERHINENDLKEALYKCRCSLENISERLWKKIYEKKYRIELSVKMSGPKFPPQLKSLVESLRKFISETAKEFEAAIPSLDYFLGQNGSSDIVWSYLNKGTHEEDGIQAFDILIVKKIRETLIELDIKVKNASAKIPKAVPDIPDSENDQKATDAKSKVKVKELKAKLNKGKQNAEVGQMNLDLKGNEG